MKRQAYPCDETTDEKKIQRTDTSSNESDGTCVAPKGWVPHRDPTAYKLPPTPTVKAYKNMEFLNSSHARSLRVMCEYEETMQRLAANGVKATVQFFGSARALDREQFDAKRAEHTAVLESTAPGSAEAEAAAAAIEKLRPLEWMCEPLEQTRELARRLTEWSMRGSRLSRTASLNGVSRMKQSLADLDTVASGGAPRANYPPHATDADFVCDAPLSGSLYVCTGGAGGFMEAANRGAADVPGGRSVGMGISLPFETGLNPYVTPELAFEYHYFFTRKLCMAFHMQALVVAPGGFGTCDEMFELMTLKQTGKMGSSVLPIVLLGVDYWRKVINWQAFVDSGTVAQRDVDSLFFTDSVDEAFDYITARIGSPRGSPMTPA